jgi:hypothetical protein
MPYFQLEMSNYLNILNDSERDDIPFYINSYFDGLSDYKTGITGVLDLMLGTFIRVNKNILIPINATLVFSFEGPFGDGGNPVPYVDTLLDSGLIIQGRYGILGVFAGHNFMVRGAVENRYTRNNFRYAVLPIVNTSEFPFFGIVVRQLTGYLGLDQNNSTSWSTRLVSMPFALGPLNFNAVEPYCMDESYNLYARHTMFGLKFDMNTSGGFYFDVDAGYRMYHDVYNTTRNIGVYGDTPYCRFSFVMGDYYPDAWSGLTFYIDRKFPIPKIGILVHIDGELDFLVEAGFYSEFELIIGLKFLTE